MYYLQGQSSRYATDSTILYFTNTAFWHAQSLAMAIIATMNSFKKCIFPYWARVQLAWKVWKSTNPQISYQENNSFLDAFCTKSSLTIHGITRLPWKKLFQTQLVIFLTCCKPCTTWACCEWIWTGVAPLGDCTMVCWIWAGPPCCGNCTIRTWNCGCGICVPIGTRGWRFVVVRLTVDVSAAIAVGDVPVPV